MLDKGVYGGKEFYNASGVAGGVSAGRTYVV